MLTWPFCLLLLVALPCLASSNVHWALSWERTPLLPTFLPLPSFHPPILSPYLYFNNNKEKCQASVAFHGSWGFDG